MFGLSTDGFNPFGEFSGGHPFSLGSFTRD
jgi:hypothetical protein